jgi:hypothetical protein
MHVVEYKTRAQQMIDDGTIDKSEVIDPKKWWRESLKEVQEIRGYMPGANMAEAMQGKSHSVSRMQELARGLNKYDLILLRDYLATTPGALVSHKGGIYEPRKEGQTAMYDMIMAGALKDIAKKYKAKIVYGFVSDVAREVSSGRDEIVQPIGNSMYGTYDLDPGYERYVSPVLIFNEALINDIKSKGRPQMALEPRDPNEQNMDRIMENFERSREETQEIKDAIERGEKPPERTIGQPVANPILGSEAGLTEEERDDARDFMRAAQEEAGGPGVKSREREAIDRAKALIKKYDPENSESGFQKLKEMVLHEDGIHMANDPAMMWLARYLKSLRSKQGYASGDRKVLAEAADMNLRYMNVGTHMSDAFRIRRQFDDDYPTYLQNLMLNAVTMPPLRIRKKIRKLEAKMDKASSEADLAKIRKKRDALIDKSTRLTAKVRSELEYFGYDILNKDVFADRYKTAKMLRIIQAAKSDWWDKFYEFFVASILSGPVTQMRNIVGTAGFAYWEFTAQKMMEASINKALPGNKAEAMTLKELKHIYSAWLPAAAEGWANMIESYRLGMPVLGGTRFEESERGASIGAGPRLLRKIIPGGNWGEFVRTPLRALQAMDELVKGAVHRATVEGYAYRLLEQHNQRVRMMEAKLKGEELRNWRKDPGNRPITGKQITTFLHEQMTNPHAEAWHMALTEADRLAWHTDVDAVPKDVANALRAVWGARYKIVFVNTPYNIFKTAVRKTPLGTLGMLAKAAVDASPASTYIYERDEKMRDIAEQIMSWGMTLALMWMAAPDDDDPWNRPRITGTDRSDIKNKPPLSIRVNGEWYSYKWIEPFATTLGLMIDAINNIGKARNGADAERIMKDLFNMGKGAFTDKTFMQGIGDIIRAFREDGRGVPEMMSDFAASWSPNLYRTVAKSFVEDYPDNKLYQKRMFSPQYNHQWRRTTGAKAFPGLIAAPATKIDPYGEPYKKHEGMSYVTDVIFRIFSPVDVHSAKADNTTDLRHWVSAWNRQRPDFPFEYTQPRRTFVVAGIEYEMTPAIYEQFLIHRGQFATRALLAQELQYIDDGTVEAQKKMIRNYLMFKKAFDKGSDYAKGLLFGQGRFMKHLESGAIYKVAEGRIPPVPAKEKVPPLR